MMNFAEFISTLNGWLGNRDYTDDQVTLWVRMAEERISEELRIKDQITIAQGVVDQNRVALPQDWLELDMVRIVDDRPIIYEPRDEFYTGSMADHYGRYTLLGNNIVVGGDFSSATRTVEISYFARVPQFTDTATWLINLYPRLYISAFMSMASMYGVEDDRGINWEQLTQNQIATLNGKYKQAKASGSVLISRARGFG